MTERGSSKKSTTAATTTRVVLTGKRIKGTWSMESRLTPKIRRSSSNEGVVIAENRYVRTLH